MLSLLILFLKKLLRQLDLGRVLNIFFKKKKLTQRYASRISVCIILKKKQNETAGRVSNLYINFLFYYLFLKNNIFKNHELLTIDIYLIDKYFFCKNLII